MNKSYYNFMIAHDYFTHNMEKLIESDSEIKNLIGGLEYLDVSMFKDYDYVALGHMHNPQRVGSDNIRYSGSILKYSFSEANHHKGGLIIELNKKGELKVEPVFFAPSHDLRKLKGTYEDNRLHFRPFVPNIF